MRKRDLILLVAGAALGLGNLPARGSTILLTGNHPQPNEQSVLLNDGSTGYSVQGMLATSGLAVQFDSVQKLTEPPTGEARIAAHNALLDNLTISVPGHTFEDLILNAHIQGSTVPTQTFNVDVVAASGAVHYTFTAGNGSNFITILANPGDALQSVTFSGGCGVTDIRQIQISGVDVPLSTVPLPRAGIGGSALLVLLGAAHWLRGRLA